MRLTPVVVVTLTALVLPGTATLDAAAAHPAAGVFTCRNQTFTWTQGAKNELNSSHGPKVRSHDAPSHTTKLTDNRVNATYQVMFVTVSTEKFVNLTTIYDQTQPKYSRFTKVILYPVKGKKKAYRVVKNPNHDYVYKQDMIKDYSQVQLPVSGSNGQGRKTPKIKKVVVKVGENCYATPS
jgi:hypothetical protein